LTTFAETKNEFVEKYKKLQKFPMSLVPVHTKIIKDIVIRDDNGEPNEEYYKWQFIYSLINSGLYQKDYLGTEIRFPKGNIKSAPLKIDAVVFDNPKWFSFYCDYWENKQSKDLEWLREHIIAVIEFKKEEKGIEKIFQSQLKPAMKEKEPSDSFILGIYYDKEKLFLFHRRNGFIDRYDENKNQRSDKEDSNSKDLSFHLPDPYHFLPSFKELKEHINRPGIITRDNRSIDDLEVITSISTVQIQNALSNILRTIDQTIGMKDQRGYNILIKTLALKIFDEKRNERNSRNRLKFYITPEEEHFSNLSEKKIQVFIERMKGIYIDAESRYQKILKNNAINWKDPKDIKIVVAVCVAFQDFSFAKSTQSDLYQLVFHNFANEYKQAEAAQFLTPLPIIEFLVDIMNPSGDETIIDPCCGIADFLSLSYIHSAKKGDNYKLKDENIFGIDLDENMIMLATLNMLLNGDGEAKLFQESNKGSILSKVAAGDPPHLIKLNPDYHAKGTWDIWPDETKLMKFDIVLTNPPFGDDRAYRPKSKEDRAIIEMYELWHLIDAKDKIDLGLVFLENAYRCLDDEGRLGIVLSSSLAAITRWKEVRKWLIERLRIVAFFDLPQNVFAETGVFTTIIVAYKPKGEELTKLKTQGYSIFTYDIQNVGYEKRTSKRNKFFNPVYRFDDQTFEIKIDNNGNPVLDEDFRFVTSEFKKWALGQEKMLQDLFIKEDKQ
jgi:type I restriction enzyme M protein